MTAPFLNNNNLQLIWELLVDEAFIHDKRAELQTNIHSVFNNNVRSFYETEKNKTDGLMSMNKKFIMSMITYINTLEHDEQIKTNTRLNSIKNTTVYKHKSTNELITIEEVQNERKVKFEQDLNRHQSDFANAVSQNVPMVPDFKIKLEEEPIKEMEKKIKEMTAQRNYDIEQITKGTNMSLSISNKAWLDTTSLSNTMTRETIPKPMLSPSNEPPKKYITIGPTDVELSDGSLNAINLASFEHDTTGLNDDDIFRKLKKTTIDQGDINYQSHTSNSLSISAHAAISNLDTKVSTLTEELKLVNEKIDKLMQYIIKNEMK